MPNASKSKFEESFTVKYAKSRRISPTISSEVLPTCSRSLNESERNHCFASAIELAVRNFDVNVKAGKLKLIEPVSEL